jgi:uncharacterized protein
MLFLLAAVVIGVGTLFVLQRRLIYFPQRMSAAEFAAAVRSVFGDYVAVIDPFDAIVLAPKPSAAIKGTVIWFHGNAGLGLDRASLAPTFARRGLRLVFAEYPGYGARGGAPSERTLVDDAQALYAKVSQQYVDLPVIVIGESLGSGVAVQVAAQPAGRPPSRLVLLTPFLSLAETAARAYWFLPARYLVLDRFDSAGQLPRYAGPVAILVAGQDEVVGAAQGRALAQLARSRGETHFLELAGASHNSWSEVIAEAQWTELLGMPPVSQ